MKRTIFIASAIILVIGMSACKSNKSMESSAQTHNGDNSRTSLDWPGVYSGVIPCADCPGIETQVTLNADNTFKMTHRYQDKGDQSYDFSGKIKWDTAGGSITLSSMDEKDDPIRFKVGENQLIQLDKHGKVITGELAPHYILTKVDMKLVEKYWKLYEIFGNNLKDLPKLSKDAYLTFKIDGNRVIGNGGCNSFNGTYESGPGNKIKFSRMASTLMMCMNIEIENKMKQVFDMADSYYVNGDTLILNKARMAPLARFEAVYLK